MVASPDIVFSYGFLSWQRVLHFNSRLVFFVKTALTSGVLPAEKSERLITNRFVNVQGGRNNNIALDVNNIKM
jgi:hypothetical protein